MLNKATTYQKTSISTTTSTPALSQTIRGLVTDIRPGQITLRLSNKQVVVANYDGAKEVSIGDVASFRITDTSGKHITVTKLDSTLSPEDLTIIRALEEANLPVTDQNQEIVKELLYHKLPITKESINHILKQALQYKDARMSTLVFLIKQGIPLSENYLSKFESYRNFSYHLFDQVANIQKEFSQLLQYASYLDSEEILLALTKEALAFYSVETPTSLQSSFTEYVPTDITVTLTSGEYMLLNELLTPYHLPEELPPSLTDSNCSLRDLYHLLSEVISKAVQDSPEHIEPFRNPLIYSIFEKYSALQLEQDELGSYLPTPSRLQLVDAMGELPITTETASSIAKGEITTNALLSLIAYHVTSENQGALRNLLKCPGLYQVFAHKLTEVFTLTPTQLQDGKQIQEYYESLLEKSEQLTKKLETLTLRSNSANLAIQAEDLNGQLDFMKSFNQLFSYIQLPIKLKEQITHGDLYVYTNNKKLQAGTDSVSVLLHLNLTHLGPLDIYLSLASNSVHSKFYVSDKETKNLVNKHTSQLKTRLEESGYSLSVEVLEQQQTPDILKDLTPTESKSTPIKRYSFDLRA